MNHKLFLILFIFIGSINIQAQNNSLEEIHLMPWPQEMKANESDFKITEEFSVFIHGEENEYGRISKAAVRFIRYMTDKTGVFVINGFPNPKGIDASAASLHIYFDTEVEVAMGIDESYSLQVTDSVIEIRAKTDVGAMHGLSSLLQLIEIKNGSYAFAGVEINDEPRFVWRGLMMDVARHFMPMDVVKRNIDAMALVKLNVFHWHLSDDQGFRVETKTLPELYQNASDGLYYTQSDVKEIVKYANDRGIRVVPEFDVPGHGTAFLTAFPDLGSKKDMEYSIERNSGIFDPTLDPTNEKTYEFLDALFKEVAPLFNDVYFHIGGDENEGKHWDENVDIQQFMKENELKDNHELQTYFNIRLEKILAKYGKSLMGWEEIMTANMPKTALIHSWRGVNEGMQPGESLVKAVKNGYQTILSNGYYIDLLLSVEDHYLVDPMPDVELTEVEAKRILGGEATMWAELVTPLTVDSRIWPRTAAIAERFWSAKEVRDIDHMYERLNSISQFLELMGIQHLKSKEYILRNIANYKDTHGLRSLTYISEPFKIYSRNAGGTEYKTYSPFTLFADACTADAKSVRDFRQLVDNYIENPNESLKKELESYLQTWEGISDQLKIIEPDAPLVSRVIPYAERVGEIAAITAKALNSNVISSEELKQLKSLVEKKEDPTVNLDVELAVANDIMRLAEYLAKK